MSIFDRNGDNMLQPTLYLVLPCFNEEDVIHSSAKKLKESMDKLVEDGIIQDTSRILFVDDGSQDHTWKYIRQLHEQDAVFEGMKLSINKGHQVAIYAGMEQAAKYADVVITMDVDLQQDLGALPEFLKLYKQGYDIVYGIRNDRKSDGFFKKTTAVLYYRLMRWMGCELLENSADYRLMSKRAVDALTKYKENNLFIRGIVPALGYKSATLYFEVHEREIGQSKYTLKKMLRLAMDGITSFSIRPIRLITGLGFILTCFSMVMIIYTLVSYFSGKTTPGWSTLLVSIWLLGGIELIGIGVVGEYIGRTYMETKRRPRYLIEEELLSDNHSAADREG